MPSKPIRKLAAIMFTDIAGYTLLASENEEKALKLINEQRSLLQIIVKEFNGTWLKEMGDGLLLSFPSSKLAVEAAIKMQQKTKEIGDLNLRIGIHQGDIIEQDGDVFGDDVNIASRIEAFSAIGGVAVTDKVMGDISSSPEYKLKFVNEPILKGIRQKIKVYCIISHGLPETKLSKVSAKVEAIEEIAFGKRIKEDNPKKIIFIRTAVVIIAIPIIWIVLNFIPDDDTGREVIADENSIAVLFIENIADPEDSLKLTQMIKELLITDLSQSKTLRVIGSQRLYDLAKKIGGQNGFQVNRDNASQIAREARVQWMLNGSLTQLGEKIILTTQIENVKDGKVLDAQRADGIELFEIIDQISSEIRNDLGIFTSKNESDFPVNEITTDSPEAYKLYVEGLAAFWEKVH